MPTDIPTRKSLLNIALSALLEGNSKLSLEEAQREGSDSNIVANIGVELAMEVLGIGVEWFNRLWLDTAKGTHLEELVFDRYGIKKNGPKTSYTDLKFSRETTGPYVNIPAGSLMKTRDGIQFLTIDPMIMGQTETVVDNVRCVAVTAGVSGNVAANTIVEIQDPDLASIDSSITVTNETAAVGGSDGETDDQFRARARGFWSSVKRGTYDAIEYGIGAEVSGVSGVTVVEEVDQYGNETGTVFVHVCDIDGYSNESMVSAVVETVKKWKAAGTRVVVVGASPVFVPIRVRVGYKVGVNTLDKREEIKTVLVAGINSLPPYYSGDVDEAGVLHVSTIISMLKKIQGIIVHYDSVLEPTGDLTPENGQVIRTRYDLIEVVY